VYTPTWVEILITIASFAGFALIIAIFVKLFPIISISEMEEGWDHRETPPTAAARVQPPQVQPEPQLGGATS
jgi:hypothetical protein